MMRTRIDYGIDLGTTNSAIARVDAGEPRIIKNDRQMDTTPSCVHFRKSTIIVGEIAYNRLSDENEAAFKRFSTDGITEHKFNTFIEFKRTMGTDTRYESESVGRSFSSDELSAEVLKFLKSLVRDDEVPAVVITVPNRFHNNQIDATQAAAELAGFDYCELLQEPIAASIAYGISANNIEGYWLVFDFGGGTFDVALMKVEEGIMRVIDTDGDPLLGGKDVDYAIVDKIIIPYIQKNYNVAEILSNPAGKAKLRDALKSPAEEAKIAISPPSKTSAPIVTYKPLGEDDDGEEIELDFTMSLEDVERAAAPEFQRAIDISKELVRRNNLSDTDLEKVVLVGGPTLSQTLRRMVQEQFNTKVDTSVDPMTAVAVGAALYASTRELPIGQQKRDRSKVQLHLKYPSTSVEDEESIGIRIERDKTDGTIPDVLFVEVSRSDHAWSSNKIKIDGDAEIINVHLSQSKLNSFEINLYDDKGNRLVCEPSSFSIMNGFKPAEATLPYDLCVDAFSEVNGDKFLTDVGLKRNQTIPAKGSTVLRTQKDVRPGAATDIIRIPLYEGEVNTRAIHNIPAGTVVITGEDIGRFLPKGSEVKIDIEVDASRRITFRAFFPDIDETIERKIERTDQDVNEFKPEDLETELKHSMALAEQLQEESASVNFFNVETLTSDLDELAELLQTDRTNKDTILKVKERLRAAAKELDTLKSADEFPRAKAELLDTLEDLRSANERFGDDKSAREVLRLEKLADEAINAENLPAVRDLTEQVGALRFRLVDIGAGVALELGFIQHHDQEFDSINWTNEPQARRLINQAKEIVISGEPTKEKLRPLVQQIARLLPEQERQKLTEIDDEFLTK